jgi:hypothetical protein
MFARSRSFLSASALAAVAALGPAACSAPGGGDGAVGTATLAITNVPADVGCVRVRAVGTRSVERDFDVKPGQSSILPISGLPIGDVDFYGLAFDGRCAELGGGALPSWVGDPAKAVIERGKTTPVTVVLRPNGRGQVAIDFQMDPDTGGPCVDKKPGCLDPDDAAGAAGGPVPDDVRMVSPREFGAALNAGDLRLGSARLEAQAELSLEEQEKRDRAVLEMLLANDPETLAELLREPEEDDRLRRAPDGNFVLKLDGREGREVITMGRRFRLHQAAEALTRFGTAENQLGIYARVYDVLPRDEILKRQLPRPEELVKESGDALLKLNLRLAHDEALIEALLKLNPNLFPPSGYPSSCAAEEGVPASLPDQTGGNCSPTNLFAKTHFPLKWRSTCVKNQGNRGSCVAFGITAAVEAAVALKHNRWVNLSEQKVYYDHTVPRSCGDGLHTSAVMTNLVSSQFKYPWEFQWDYNPTYSRPYDACPYINSCVSYGGEHCSNTSHQGDKVCVDILFFRFCGWDGSAPGSSGFRLAQTVHLFSLFGKSTGTALARMFLAAGIPIVYSFDVVTSFDNKANSVTDGIVTSVNNEKSRGGHAVALMGFIDNSKLPAGTPAGAGGGYFVMKNSWGKCAGDGGYLYIPYDWAMKHGGSMSTASVN